VVSPEGWLLSSVSSFCPQGKLQLRSVVSHYQIVQGGQIYTVFTRQQLIHNSEWSALPLNKARQLSFVHQQSHEINSANCHTPALGGCFFCAPLTTTPHSQCSFLALSHSLRLVQHSTPPPLTVVNYIHCQCHSVSFGGGVQSVH
jgi:hypothetical protein